MEAAPVAAALPSASPSPSPAAALPSAAQGSGLGASQVSEAKVSELTPRVSERLALATLGRGEFFGENENLESRYTPSALP